jgi:hypothetical protein
VDRNEASLLHVFDVNRVRIQALFIRGGGRIIIDCRRRIYWNRTIVEENMPEVTGTAIARQRS